MIGVGEYLLAMFLISIIAGLIGSLVGIGGGILIVPILTIFFGIPIEFAIGASIVSVIATSSGSASAYVRDRITNLRVGMFLEVATTTGAVIGAITTIFLITSGLEWIVFVSFGLVLLSASLDMYNRSRMGHASPESSVNRIPNQTAERLKLKGEYYDTALHEKIDYIATRVPAGLSVMFCAGLLSGLLGIGSGALKVLGMDTAMRLPFKVSTTTSNFMIGVTAAASTGIFYIEGFVNPLLAAPIAIGVVIGSFAGAKVLVRSKPVWLRILFIIVLIAFGIEMLQRGFTLNGVL